ncbi:MAG: aminopeptidase P family protein [Clostridium sp.]|nr:aminopeptidase P family protein [Clostridium sp.]
MFTERREKLENLMVEKDIGQMIVTDPTSIFYLTGYKIDPGERLLALLFKKDKKPSLFINRLFPIKEKKNLEYIYLKDSDDSIAKILFYLDKRNSIGIDKTWPSGFLIELLNKGFKGKLINSSLLVDSLRQVKDSKEINLMKRVSELNDMAMKKIISKIREGISELELEEELKKIYLEIDSDGYSFSPIIAFMENGASPHHENGNKRLSKGDSIIFDIGCMKDNYASDMTRTVFYKSISKKQKDIYNIVLKANKRAIAGVKPGVKAKDIDSLARDYITKKGYGEEFMHRTGHFIGIDVHEYGDISESNEDVLKEGMIFSVEPGIYLENEFGVRIEDLILVTKEGYYNLNSFSKEIIIVK